VARFFEIACVI